MTITDLMRESSSMAGNRKPNLILFLPDQQRADTLACYGGVKVHAPNLNKLASESVIFERTYVTHPVCTPSRSSLMTGTWPHINGCTRNSVPLDRRRAQQTKRWILGSSRQQSADRVVAAKVSRETRVRLHRGTSARSFHFSGCVRGTTFALQRSAQRCESARRDRARREGYASRTRRHS